MDKRLHWSAQSANAQRQVKQKLIGFMLDAGFSLKSAI